MTAFRHQTELSEGQWVEVSGTVKHGYKFYDHSRPVDCCIIEEITDMETGADVYGDVPQQILRILEEEISEAVENGRA